MSFLPDIMGYNAVECCNTLADHDETQKLCHPAELLFITGGGNCMAVSYKKLWKLLIDKDIKKKDLCAMASISPATITKMGKGGHVTTEVLLKICRALNCRVEDIMEIVENPQH